ncbi:MAG: hypothetical protein ABIP50_00165 [Candidatus Saccharimonadales bacterium]
MKSVSKVVVRVLMMILRVSKIVGVVLAVLIGITLMGWFAWQIMPMNPHHDQWRWDVPPFPKAILPWIVGIPFLIAAIGGGVLITFVGRGVLSLIFRRKDPPPPASPTTG